MGEELIGRPTAAWSTLPAQDDVQPARAKQFAVSQHAAHGRYSSTVTSRHLTKAFAEMFIASEQYLREKQCKDELFFTFETRLF